MLTYKSIAYPELFGIVDKDSQKPHYGGNQLWYPKKLQRLSGCGPTVASNIFFYLSHPKNMPELSKSPTKEDWIAFMEKMWGIVTPSLLGGVNTTEMFFKPLLEYIKKQGFDLQYYVCEVPKKMSNRPDLSQVVHFLDRALSKDAPVAFLNLCNGEVNNLDRWHWVTIISLEYHEPENIAHVNILDEGEIKKIDLALWLRTTTRGGGFVYFA